MLMIVMKYIWMFTSPTAFKKTGGGYLSQPDAEYIFMSLFNRWNAFAPHQLPDELKITIQKHLHIVDTKIFHHTIKFARGRKGIVTGFCGKVFVKINEPSTRLRCIIHALANFSMFSGVGVKTTAGMGQVHLEQKI